MAKLNEMIREFRESINQSAEALAMLLPIPIRNKDKIKIPLNIMDLSIIFQEEYGLSSWAQNPKLLESKSYAFHLLKNDWKYSIL